MAGGYSLVLARREGARLRNLLDTLLGLILMAGGYSLVLVVAPDAREFYRCLPLFLMTGRELAYACGSTICREGILPCLHCTIYTEEGARLAHVCWLGSIFITPENPAIKISNV